MNLTQCTTASAWSLAAAAWLPMAFAAPAALAEPTAEVSAASTHSPAASATLALELAERYGYANWPNVARIDFTFRVELPDGRVIERPWSWDTQANTVTADFGKDEARTFALDAIDDTHRDDHAKFINDSYWLLFPFQLVWSTNTITEDGESVMPISGKPATKWTVTYPGEGGYTPGDMYELFLDPATGMIAEWNFRKSGGEQGRPATWEGNRTLHGITFQDTHRGPEGSGFSLTFPVIQVHER